MSDHNHIVCDYMGKCPRCGKGLNPKYPDHCKCRKRRMTVTNKDNADTDKGLALLNDEEIYEIVHDAFYADVDGQGLDPHQEKGVYFRAIRDAQAHKQQAADLDILMAAKMVPQSYNDKVASEVAAAVKATQDKINLMLKPAGLMLCWYTQDGVSGVMEYSLAELNGDEIDVATLRGNEATY